MARTLLAVFLLCVAQSSYGITSICNMLIPASLPTHTTLNIPAHVVQAPPAEVLIAHWFVAATDIFQAAVPPLETIGTVSGEPLAAFQLVNIVGPPFQVFELRIGPQATILGAAEVVGSSSIGCIIPDPATGFLTSTTISSDICSATVPVI